MPRWEKKEGRPITEPMIAELEPYVKDPKATKKVTAKVVTVPSGTSCHYICWDVPISLEYPRL
jgi:hypothetical protein